MRKRLRVAAIGSIVVMMATSTACGRINVSPNKATPTQNPSAQSGTGNMQSQSLSQTGQGTTLGNDDAVIPIKVINNVNYVAANELIQTLKFNSDWVDSNQKLLIGDNDANFEVTMNSTKARKEGSDIQVSQSFIKEGDSAYLPVTALADLFQEDMAYEVRNGQLLIHAAPVAPIEHEDDNDPRGNSAELDFKDDPTDPFKGEGTGANPASMQQKENDLLEVWSPANHEEVIPVLKNIDMNAVINKGKQYLGVKYLFGTGPYPQTGKFDCSTFTQYVFGKYGVKLPRLARQQALQGQLVSRNSLRKGDLMFFYVPGRFKTNKTVGHVGIYIGNMQMLHSSPAPKDGVQISNIDKPYWKSTFLRAKRIAY